MEGIGSASYRIKSRYRGVWLGKLEQAFVVWSQTALFACSYGTTAHVAQSGHSKHRLRPVRDVLRDRNYLKLLTRCVDFIPNSFAHQKPCHWGYEGNRTGLRVRFVLSHDTIFLYAPIAAPKGHRAPKGDPLPTADTKRGNLDIDDIRQTDLTSDNDGDGCQGSKVTAETNATWTSTRHSTE